MMTSAEIQHALGISEQTLGRWRKQGLPCHRIGIRRYRYDAIEILAWQANRTQRLSSSLSELVELNSSMASLVAQGRIHLHVRGVRTTLQDWLPEELLRLSELPDTVERETALRDLLGFARVGLMVWGDQ